MSALRLSFICLIFTAVTALPTAHFARAQDAQSRRELRRTPVVEVFESARESVVNISSTQIVQVRSPFGFESPLEDFFHLDRRRPRRMTRTSVGSGFVLHRDGYIVTNAHVVAATAQRKIIFSEDRQFDAQVIAIDPQHDLAILKIETDEPLTPLPLGTSSDIMVGETVIAIGDPLGYEHSLTTGVVSALDRTLELKGNVTFEGLIQTDASINPGNSGGPLLNILGELIGINTAIRSDAQNIGFAIPVDQLREMLPDLMDVERRLRIITGIVVDANNRVVSVQEASSAQQNGIVPGDRILQMNDQPISGVLDYHIALFQRQAGETLQLQIEREGKIISGELPLAERPRPDGEKLLKLRYGVEAKPITERMARAFSTPGLTGLIVTQVEPDSPAAQINLQRGDVIVQIGRHEPNNFDDVGLLLEAVRPGQSVTVTVLRIQGRSMYRLSAPIVAR